LWPWLFLLLVAHPFDVCAVGLSPCLEKVGAKDSVCRVWVLFNEKPITAGRMQFPPRTLHRRARAGFITACATEFPVADKFIAEIGRMGGKLRKVFPWANAASFSIPGTALPVIASRDFVKKVIPMRSFTARPTRSLSQRLPKLSEFPDTGSYGVSLRQMRMVGVPEAHDYIVNTLKRVPGDGVLIGLFDSGFRTSHRCFGYLKSHGSILADSNFIDRSGEVSDPDSVLRAFSDGPPEEPGSQTLALLGGYDPGRFLGVAWGARFVLAKTEWVGRVVNGAGVEVEVHGEEDNWAAALVWAESLGVDVVSSSLAYRTDFTDSLGGDKTDEDYTFDDLDGKTTIISRAAREAARRGVVIVNSMGNDGDLIDGPSINAPADVEDVVSVGGVYGDKSICIFSSRGPTADGRIKPDVVALGYGVAIPDIYSADSAAYTTGMGTSFAAPVVAGVCALIRQTHPSDSAERIRRLLYASCSFAPKQTAVDTAYGRGIPNALKACYNDSVAPVAGTQFRLFPTTLDIIRKKQSLTLEFIALQDDPSHYSQRLTVEIRTVSGKLVWGHSEILAENRKKVLSWPDSRKPYAPGMYYCIVNYAGKTHVRKFIIIG
jgi:hypothetical protein